VDNHAMDVAFLYPDAGHFVADGATITGEVTVTGATCAVTQAVWRVEGKAVATNASPPYALAWPATNVCIGPVSLQAQAWSSAGETAVSERRDVVVYTDGDGDGMADQWEFDRLGSATNTSAGTDSDADGTDDVTEFVSDTDPASSTSRFDIVDAAMTELLSLDVATSTARYYRVWIATNAMDGASWAATSNRFRGAAGVSSWAETNAPASGGDARFYRVTAELP